MDKKSLVDLLRKTTPFKYVSDQEMAIIIRYGDIVSYNHRDVILMQGNIGPGLLVILNGKTRVTVKLLNRGNIELADLIAGQFFGEVNLLDNSPCTATVQSIKKTSCFLLKKSIFDMLHVAYPAICYQINQAIVENVLIRQAHDVEEIKLLSKKAHRHRVYLSPLKSSSSFAKKVKLSFTEKQKRFSYLSVLPVLTTIFDPDEIDYFIKLAQVIEVSHHYRLINKHDKVESYFFILKGSVTVGIPTTKEGVKFAVLGPNTLFCTTSIFDGKTSLFSYETHGSALLLEISGEALHMMKKQQPTFWYKLHDAGCRYIISLQRRLNTQIVRSSSETSESTIPLSK